MHSRFHEKHVSALTAIEVYELRSFYDTIFVKFSEMWNIYRYASSRMPSLVKWSEIFYLISVPKRADNALRTIAKWPLKRTLPIG